MQEPDTPLLREEPQYLRVLVFKHISKETMFNAYLLLSEYVCNVYMVSECRLIINAFAQQLARHNSD